MKSSSWQSGNTVETEELPSSTGDEVNERSNGDDKYEIPGDFPEIDHISLYTIRIYIILGVPLLLSAGFTVSYVFTAGTVGYRCLVAECEDPVDTTPYPSWLSNAVPYSNGQPATCTRYIVQNITDSCLTTIFTNETQSCDAWVYDSDEVTIQNEWDLTCENNLWKLTLPGTINNVGQFVGLIFAGYFSDRYGRRYLLVVSTILSTTFGLIRSLSINYEMFVIFEFLDAVGGAGLYSAAFVLGMEFVGPKKRVLMSNVLCCMYSTGQVVLALVAMWLRSWRFVIITLYIPGLLAVFIPAVVPESVRWLLSRGRVAEAETVLRKVAVKNKIEISQTSIDRIRNSKKNNIQAKNRRDESTFLDVSIKRQVLGNRVICIRLATCVICWITNTLVYYGLSLQSVYVPGDKYVNFILVALVEIPAQLTAWALVDHLGRKPTLSGAFLCSGIFCIISIFVSEDWSYLLLIVFMGGKYSITVAFSAMYVYTAEMFPTPIRHSLLGFCSMSARIGSMIAPQMPLLETYMASLPLLLFGSIAILASILSLIFPETKGIKLPDTMDEAVNITKLKKERKLVSSIF